MLKNLVEETANNPGTGISVNLAGAPTGRNPFIPAFGDGDLCFYIMADGTQSEWGIATLKAASPNVLSRTTVLGNTAGSTARLNFVGAVRVFNEVPAEMMQWGAASTVTTAPGAVDIAIPSVGRVFEIDVAIAGLAGSAAGRTLNGYLSIDGSGFLTAADSYVAQVELSYGAAHADAYSAVPAIPLSALWDVPQTPGDLTLRLTLGSGVIHVKWDLGYVYNASTRAMRRGWSVTNTSSRPKTLRLVDSAGAGLLAGTFASVRRVG